MKRELFENLPKHDQDEIVNYLGSLPFTDEVIRKGLFTIDALCECKPEKGWFVSVNSFFDLVYFLRNEAFKKGIQLKS